MEVANRTGVGFIPKDITFAEWAMKWLETYKKPDVDENTYIDTYMNCVVKHIIPYLGKATLSNIKPIDIKSFYTTKQHMSTSRLSKMRICLNGIFETAIDNGLCSQNPARGITFISQKDKSIKKVYSDDEIKIVETLSVNDMPEIVVLLETGLRRGELLGLKWSDIDFYKKTISVNRSIATKKGGGISIHSPKWNSYRTNPLSNTAISIFANLKNQKSNGYIFPLANGNPQNPNTWSQKLQRFMNNLPPDIPRLTAHELRHTYGTYLRRHKVDIYSIQKVMGHKDINVTSEIYVHNEIDSLKSALQIINTREI